MKRVLKNSLLVVVFGTLLTVPMWGFLFISEQEVEGSKVLGARVTHRQLSKSIEVVDQVDIKLILGKGATQRFYDVVPTMYQTKSYKIVPIISKNLKKVGVSVNLKDNDLIVNVPSTFKEGEIELTLLVLR